MGKICGLMKNTELHSIVVDRLFVKSNVGSFAPLESRLRRLGYYYKLLSTDKSNEAPLGLASKTSISAPNHLVGGELNSDSCNFDCCIRCCTTDAVEPGL